MTVKIELSKYRVLMIAILLSFVWHIFWLSAIKVTSSSGRINTVKFSKISFLGPILTRSPIEARVEPKDKSFLENRYALAAENVSDRKTWRINDAFVKGVFAGTSHPNNETLAALIDEAVSGPKLEPSCEIG